MVAWLVPSSRCVGVHRRRDGRWVCRCCLVVVSCPIRSPSGEQGKKRKRGAKRVKDDMEVVTENQ